jgi:hypothetical protein
MSDRRIAIRLFSFFFALYALTSSGNAFRVPDEFEVYFQAEHLLDAGDLSVPQTLAITQDGQPIFFGQVGLDGKPYAPYGPGVAFLILPFHALGRLVAAAAAIPREPLPGGIAWELVVGGVTALGMAFAAALAIAGCYRCCIALGASARRAVALAATLGAATVLWPSGTTLYSEAWLAAGFIWAAERLLAARTGARAEARVMTAAILLAVAGMTKPTALVIAPGFIAAALAATFLRVRTRIVVAASLTVAIAFAIGVHLAWNVTRFGRPLDFGYNLGAMIPQPPARPFMLEQIPWGLFVQLLTPGKSLFVWAPVTLLSLLAMRRIASREPGLVVGLLASLAAALLFYAAFFLPEGGYSHGPRHLVPLVPLLILPLAVPGAPLPRRALLACAASGFFLSAIAVSVSFLEDQSPPQRSAVLISPYYERIDPPPGGPYLRYRTDYIPFKYALTSGHWMAPSRAVGDGPDFFALHLARGRTQVPGGSAIPPALPWLLSLPWVLVLGWAGYALAVEWKFTMNRSNA